MGRSNYRSGILYAIALCLHPVSVLAQEKPVTNIAAPQASSSGSVVNQGVQVLNGPYMQQIYGGGVACQTSSLAMTPFISSMANYPWDPTQYGAHTLSPGMAMTMNFPLDGGAVELCKERARVEIDRYRAEAAKAKLDFELVRLLKCGEAIKSGVSFHPKSPYAAVCADIVVSPRQSVPTVVAPSSSTARSN
jgi:hypothetical protein